MESAEKKAKRGKRGQGCIYLPKNSRNYWIKFSINGQTVQRSANTESRRDALDELKAQILRYSNGEAVDSRRVTIAALAESLMQLWRNHDKNPASIEWAGYCWKRLLPHFGKMKADALPTAAIGDYIEKRKAEGAANGTINRELTILSCAFTMAYNETPRRVSRKLSFTRLPGPKGRQGFVEQAQYRALAAHCTAVYMRTMLALAYSFGSRKGELLGLKVRNVDLLAGTISLDTSKNGDARKVSLTKETRQLLAGCIVGKGPEDAVFTRQEVSGRHVPVADFRGIWDKITLAAGCPGLLFHDLRRSAVRNMVRAGIPETVCMKISGHRTRNTFDRYNISSERDLIEAAKKIESAELSYSLVKVEQVDEKAKGVQNEIVQ
jgi:integrase